MAKGGPSKKVYSGLPFDSSSCFWKASISVQYASTFSSSSGKFGLSGTMRKEGEKERGLDFCFTVRVYGNLIDEIKVVNNESMTPIEINKFWSVK